MNKILFTGGGGAGNELIFRSLKNNYDLFFCDIFKDNIDPSIPSKRKETIPSPNSPKFIEKLNKICKKRAIDLLVPTVDEELLEIEKVKTNILLPDQKYIKKMIDKFNMVKAIETKGLEAPKVWKSSEINNIDKSFFPIIAKPRQGRGSRNVEIIRSRDHFKCYLEFYNLSEEEVFLEQLIDGFEYTVLMAADQKNELRAIVPVKVLSKKGITLRAFTDKEPKVIDFCNQLHSLFPTKGCYNVQLKLSSNGKPLPFEINPRISTTFGLGLASGVDPISIFLYGKDRTYNSKGIGDFKEGVSITRHWHNHIK